jgi:O-antigen/teichoic acid export membrane protein
MIYQSSLKRNVVANFLGSAFTGVSSLIFIPIYIKFIGIEAYGLVGLFSVLQAACAILDMGLSGTLNREFSRLSTNRNNISIMRDLLKSMEFLYWFTGLIFALGLIIFSQTIAIKWINFSDTTFSTVNISIKLMGGVLFFLWPNALYSGGFNGIQQQITLNKVLVLGAILKNIGVILVLWLVSPTIEAFWSWQVFAAAVQSLILRYKLWEFISLKDHQSAFSKKLLLKTWRFAAGLGGISICGILLFNTDKVMLSKILPLKSFSFYSIATAVASSLHRIINPIFMALYPRFTQVVASNDLKKLVKQFHQGSQLISVTVLPVASMLFVFAERILLIWTQNSLLAGNTFRIMQILVLGYTLNCLATAPFLLNLAHGSIKFILFSNIALLIIVMPSLFYGILYFKALGAALIMAAINLFYFIIVSPLSIKWFIPGEIKKWLFGDILLPLIACLVVILPGSFFLKNAQISIAVNLLGLTTIGLLSLISSVGGAKEIRKLIFNYYQEKRSKIS